MLTIRDPADADRIGDPSIRSVVLGRLAEVLDGELKDPLGGSPPNSQASAMGSLG